MKTCLNCHKEITKNKFCAHHCANSYNARKRKIENESIFQDGLNNENSYILGLLTADGCVSFDNYSYRYRISIFLNDVEMIMKLHDKMTLMK